MVAESSRGQKMFRISGMLSPIYYSPNGLKSASEPYFDESQLRHFGCRMALDVFTQIGL